MSRSKFYPVNVWTLTVAFHPFVWGLRYSGRGVQSRAWHQEKDIAVRWLRIGPFTISEGYLL